MQRISLSLALSTCLALASPAQADDALMQAAQAGHPQAQHDLGEMYELGNGVAADEREAVRWYEKAAQQGHIQAQVALGMLYGAGSAAVRDDAKARHWLNKAAKAGDEDAHLALELMDIMGDDGADAEQGGDLALLGTFMKEVGEAQEAGRGYDESLWAGLYGATKEHGELDAQEQASLDTRDGIMRDLFAAAKEHKGGEEAFWRTYEAALKQGEAGRAYILGQAAQQGNKDAQFQLAQHYASGSGVAQNHKNAAYWYHQAAVQGHIGAQVNLGSLYHKGEGVERDYSAALHWYHQAAAQGHPGGQFNLALMYEKGEGVERDYVLAYHWHERIKLQLGKPLVNALYLEQLEAKMTPEQLAQARTLARQAVR